MGIFICGSVEMQCNITSNTIDLVMNSGSSTVNPNVLSLMDRSRLYVSFITTYHVICEIMVQNLDFLMIFKLKKQVTNVSSNHGYLEIGEIWHCWYIVHIWKRHIFFSLSGLVNLICFVVCTLTLLKYGRLQAAQKLHKF